jgi:hypothetical protein
MTLYVLKKANTPKDEFLQWSSAGECTWVTPGEDPCDITVYPLQAAQETRNYLRESIKTEVVLVPFSTT